MEPEDINNFKPEDDEVLQQTVELPDAINDIYRVVDVITKHITVYRPLRPWQVEAMNMVVDAVYLRDPREDAVNVLVEQPTGNGKTTIGVGAALIGLTPGKRALIVVPSVAEAVMWEKVLVNTFHIPQRFVGRMAGSNPKIKTLYNKRIVVATYEHGLLQMLRAGFVRQVVTGTDSMNNPTYSDWTLKDHLGVLVIDEVHNIDNERGYTVDEMMVIARYHNIPVVAMSGTLTPRAKQILRSRLERPRYVFQPEVMERAYPMFAREVVSSTQGRGADSEARKKLAIAYARTFNFVSTPGAPRLLVFVSTIRRVYDIAAELAANMPNVLINNAAEILKNFHISYPPRYTQQDKRDFDKQVSRWLSRGVLVYHGGAGPEFDIDTTLGANPGIRVIVTTTALQSGVDLPGIQTVVMIDSTKANVPLNTNEITQSIGRGGRDRVGFGYYPQGVPPQAGELTLPNGGEFLFSVLNMGFTDLEIDLGAEIAEWQQMFYHRFDTAEVRRFFDTYTTVEDSTHYKSIPHLTSLLRQGVEFDTLNTFMWIFHAHIGRELGEWVYQDFTKGSTAEATDYRMLILRFLFVAGFRRRFDLRKNVKSFTWYHDFCTKWNIPYVDFSAPGKGMGYPPNYYKDDHIDHIDAVERVRVGDEGRSSNLKLLRETQQSKQQRERNRRNNSSGAITQAQMFHSSSTAFRNSIWWPFINRWERAYVFDPLSDDPLDGAASYLFMMCFLNALWGITAPWVELTFESPINMLTYINNLSEKLYLFVQNYFSPKEDDVWMVQNAQMLQRFMALIPHNRDIFFRRANLPVVVIPNTGQLHIKGVGTYGDKDIPVLGNAQAGGYVAVSILQTPFANYANAPSSPAYLDVLNQTMLIRAQVKSEEEMSALVESVNILCSYVMQSSMEWVIPELREIIYTERRINWG